RFAGALDTYTIEAMMQDGKALQSGTSHFLGQNFGKAFDVQFLNKEVQPIMEALRAKGISVKFDDSDNKRPGFKFADYELKGVPVRLVLGARDLENGTIEVMRRDTLEKETRPLEGIAQYVEQLLEDIQENIFNKAKAYRDERIYECDNYEEFKERVKDGGFFLCHWDGTAETEAKIKEDTQATIRCVPYGFEQTPGTDMVSGKPSKARVIIARSY
ncbi:MAG: proline--tRNA ligase, partial [Prevotella sp.]|nr:proline--tRNA ligase [Prevotella sp.]